MRPILLLALLIFVLGNSSCDDTGEIGHPWLTFSELHFEGHIDEELFKLKYIASCSYYRKPTRALKKTYKNLKVRWYDQNGDIISEAYFYLQEAKKNRDEQDLNKTDINIISYLYYPLDKELDNDEEIIKIFRVDDETKEEQFLLEIQKNELPKGSSNCKKHPFISISEPTKEAQKI